MFKRTFLNRVLLVTLLLDVFLGESFASSKEDMNDLESRKPPKVSSSKTGGNAPGSEDEKSGGGSGKNAIVSSSQQPTEDFDAALRYLKANLYSKAISTFEALVERGSFEAVPYLIALTNSYNGKDQPLEGHTSPRTPLKNPRVEALLDLVFKKTLPKYEMSRSQRRKSGLKTRVDQNVFYTGSLDDLLREICNENLRKVALIKKQDESIRIRMIVGLELGDFSQRLAALQTLTNYARLDTQNPMVVGLVRSVLQQRDLSLKQRIFYSAYMALFPGDNFFSGDDLLQGTQKYELVEKLLPFRNASQLKSLCAIFRDTPEKNMYLKLVADQGVVSIQVIYAGTLYNGDGVHKNLKTARTYFKMAADQEDAEAQSNYATMLYNGEGGNQNLEEARIYCKMAVDQGNADAHYLYAMMMRDGKGGDQNLEEARAYFKIAADQGKAKAQYSYAAMLYNGEGGDQNLEEALIYCKMAADQEDADAQYLYAAMLYNNGEGGDQNLEEALIYCKMAADQKDAEAQYLYAMMLHNEETRDESIEEARIYCKRAADQEDADAQYLYAMMLHNGEGGDQNLEEALIYLKRAADQGKAEAQYNYAVMLHNGEGGNQNLKVAEKYFQLAAKQNLLEAIKFMLAEDEDTYIKEESSDESDDEAELHPPKQSTKRSGGGGAKEEVHTPKKSPNKKTTLVIKFSKTKKEPEILALDRLDSIDHISDKKAREFVRDFFDPQAARSLKERNLISTLKTLGTTVKNTKSGYKATIQNPSSMVEMTSFSWHKGHGGHEKAFHKGGFRRSLAEFFHSMGYHSSKKSIFGRAS